MQLGKRRVNAISVDRDIGKHSARYFAAAGTRGISA